MIVVGKTEQMIVVDIVKTEKGAENLCTKELDQPPAACLDQILCGFKSRLNSADQSLPCA